MTDRTNYPKLFAAECNDINPLLDTHEEPASPRAPACDRREPPRVNHADRQPTAVHQSSPGPVETAREVNRVPTPGQPPPPAANDRRSGNGEAPASQELSSPLVDYDTGSPPEVRYPLRNVLSEDTVRKRPLSAHGTSGHTSQAVDDTSNRLPLTSSDTDEEQTYQRHSDDGLEHPDDVEHDGPRKPKKGHEQMRKRPRVETGAQADI